MGPIPAVSSYGKVSSRAGAQALPDAERQCFVAVVEGFDEEPVLLPRCVAKQEFVLADWAPFSKAEPAQAGKDLAGGQGAKVLREGAGANEVP